MDVQALSDAALNTIDFTHPPVPDFNETVLTGLKKGIPQFFVGCAKWGRPEWVGMLYPPKTKDKDFLNEYAKHFNSIELNATHYKRYSKEGIERWVEAVNGKPFRFCPKLYKGITHTGRLTGKGGLFSDVLDSYSAFGSTLGPIFIQLPQTFGPQRKEELYEFITSLPPGYDYFVEFRHPEWFSNADAFFEIATLLRRQHVGIVITDTAHRRDTMHLTMTVPKLFIRYVGNNLHATDYARINAWAHRLKTGIAEGLEEIYFFCHSEDEGKTPLLAKYVVEEFNKVCNAQLKVPQLQPK